MKRVRLFLSSPGDVRDERNLARRVVEQLNSERAFAYPLKRVLGLQGVREEDLVGALQADAEAFSTHAASFLEVAEEVRGLLLVVDQLEEAFPRPTTSKPDQPDNQALARFTAVLAQAARTGGVRGW